jgi:hypothetical protein
MIAITTRSAMSGKALLRDEDMTFSYRRISCPDIDVPDKEAGFGETPKQNGYNRTDAAVNIIRRFLGMSRK